MTLDQYTKKYIACENDAERKTLLAQYSIVLDTMTSEEHTVIVNNIANQVQLLTEKVMPKTPQETVVSIKDYCDARKISRQYVYQEIKKGKFKTIELPIYVEYMGKKIEVGNQKFLAF